MSSGIDVHPSAVARFDAIKQGAQHKYAFFKIGRAEGETLDKIVIDYEAPKSTTVTVDDEKESWDEMKTRLIGLRGPRYVVYDFRYTSDSGQQINKATFIFWCPDTTASVKDKMKYAASHDYVKRAFTGLQKYHQLNDVDQLDFDTIVRESSKLI